MSYHSTPNKELIRVAWDLPLLRRWKAQTGHPLRYFGLPGPDIHDFIDWADVLAPERTAIETWGYTAAEKAAAHDRMGRLTMNVMAWRMGSGFELLAGDVEDVIIDCVDTRGITPQCIEGTKAHRAKFRYDLVNLDFDGGLAFVNSIGAARRSDAIKKLLERQSGYSFLLLLTVNVRDKLGQQIREYLDGLGRRAGTANQDLAKWYQTRRAGERIYALKAIVPTFIRSAAELRAFRCFSYPPISYVGFENARMIHFAFELTARPASLRAFSDQDDVALMRLPLLESTDGALRLAAKQAPMCDFDTCRRALGFLENGALERLLRPAVSGQAHE